MKLFARRALALMAWSPLVLVVAGCGNQGEGERCDLTNGYLDCDEGYFCKEVYVGRYYRICCPVSGPVTVATCNTSGTPPTTDAGRTTDVRTDVGTDATAPDVGNDAAEEPTEDSATVDTSADFSADPVVDMSIPEVSIDRANGDALADRPGTPDQTSVDAPADTPPLDAPAADTAPDAPADVANEASPDVDLDIMTPIDALDAADATSLDGPG